MGDRGRLVVPAEVRTRHGFEKGTSLIFMETPLGLVLTSRETLLARIQSELEGSNLVEELVAERRREAVIEDAG
ncbi:MAG: AbrB/MazE/SpoVT family DNA-binding domain-containing protein [bacterium]|nr:AbrB/MazE/SpoVT family DNA-binding domain-containing protein [bacterium]MDE0437061.1 AbrB/MazE/SpoVT family DNA-binding domain-containing protein [bacterium]